MKSVNIEFSKDEVEYLLYVMTVTRNQMIFPEEIKRELGESLLQKFLETSKRMEKKELTV